ncbi:UDP-N-acetylglucosamine-dolichyl-phosphate N-acetylglucosaminephosphate transferase [Purpureocillium lavendulum]|uniref:UDP-N-acetylglucosamine--dolichyl-phosphate N-acetylglucosaminephosphotransferase n=1 Tax=Purpureocillium lavendulum TaxID=1247861 RepID=A0AB34G058_9HYPO|nr:UDP-N-acetylglucosamine-dolichyl-phosphate N-acetylglucosaminephosphate transferase [Purpureocillium lavendulum]
MAVTAHHVAASSTSLSRPETLTLLALSGASVAIIANTFHGDGEPLVASLALSILAFCLSYAMIRWLGPTFMKAGFRGRDLSKLNKIEIPECMGAVCAAVYLLTVIVFIPFPFYKDIVAATSGGGNRDVVLEVQEVNQGRFLHRFPHNKLASYLGAIIALQTIAFLGIGDDLFDIRWRHKWWIPGLASIPILVVYFVDFGVTSIVIPVQLQPYLGELFDLGALYYVYMACVAMFCPQSINMLAGINGIEVSQCVVVAILIAFNDCLYLLTPYPHPATDSHLFSLYLLLPWIGVSCALLYHNWYPAKVFVGDTYCYFSGMVFAVVGILGHFSKTLGLLLVPQIFNFLYSCPQIFGLVPCPRHRLPKFNARTGLLEPSVTPWSPERQPRPLVGQLLHLLAKLRLLQVTVDDKGAFVETSNFTILNLWLFVKGFTRNQSKPGDALIWLLFWNMFCRSTVLASLFADVISAASHGSSVKAKTDHETWFTQFEAITHSVVEYVPLLGTLYSVERAAISLREDDGPRYWQSLADAIESSVRDILIVQSWAEPIPVTLVHNMAESFTDRMIDIYHSWPHTPEVGIKRLLNRRYEHVIVAESQIGKSADEFFTGKAKGVYYFYGARYEGILKESLYAPKGEIIRLDIPRGFYNGAPIMFTWKWTEDASGARNRPEATHARIKMRPGTPMQFILRDRQGAGGWVGYDFWGEINSRDSITAYTMIDGKSIRIDFKKIEGAR